MGTTINRFKNIEVFKNICKMSQTSLKNYLKTQLIEFGYDAIVSDGFIYARGDNSIPVLITAHLDTVHKELVRETKVTVERNKTTISSPQGIGGDDRCGVYMILKLLERGLKPYILFCEDEEIGGIGSAKFCKTEHIHELENLNYLIELDRANGDDAVFYDCGNPDFIEWIQTVTGYKENYGSFSDISHLSPKCQVASVNLSCGYYNAHTLKEYVIFEEMENTIDVCEKLLKTDSIPYAYMEKKPYYGGYYGKTSCYGRAYGGYDYDDYEDYYGGYSSYYEYLANRGNQANTTKKGLVTVRSNIEDDDVIVYVTYYDNFGKENYDDATGRTKKEALCNFFLAHPDICADCVLDYEFDYIC